MESLGLGVVVLLALAAYLVFPRKKPGTTEVTSPIQSVIEPTSYERPVVTSFREQINLEDKAILADYFIQKRKEKQRDELLGELKSYLG